MNLNLNLLKLCYTQAVIITVDVMMMNIYCDVAVLALRVRLKDTSKFFTPFISIRNFTYLWL